MVPNFVQECIVLDAIFFKHIMPKYNLPINSVQWAGPLGLL